jgi:hypothetical protein
MNIPISAQTYLQERQRVTGKQVRLSADNLLIFARLDKRLYQLDIDPKDYIQVSVRVWTTFSQQQSMEFPPINILCGEKAIQAYQELDPVSDTEYCRSVLLYTEIQICSLLINASVYYPSIALEDTEEMKMLEHEFEYLCGISFEDYVRDNPTVVREIRQESMIHVAREYGVVADVSTYSELAAKIVQKRARLGYR